MNTWVHYLWSIHLGLFVWMVVLLMLYSYLYREGHVPTIGTMQQAVALLDSRGGNILVLALFTGAVLMAINYEKMPLNFWTGTAFGAFSGALLKTMTGGSSTGRTGDVKNGGTNGTTSTTQTVPAPPAPSAP